MKTRTLLLTGIISSGAILGNTAHSEELALDWYTGGDIAFTSIDLDFVNLDEKTSPIATNLRGGVQFHPYVAVELRYSMGLADEDANAPVSQANFSGNLLGKVSFENSLSFLVKGILPTKLPVRPYALLGYTQGDFTLEGKVVTPAGATVATVNETFSESGVSMGGGIDLLGAEKISVNVEYLISLSTKSSSLAAFNFGLNYHW